MASLIDTVNALRSEIGAGVRVVQIKRTTTPKSPQPVTRPKWLKDRQGGDEIVMHPRDLAQKMMGG